MWACSLFFAAAHFYFDDEIGLLCLFFFFFNISGSSSFSVIHANVDFKNKSKERIGFVVVVFLSMKVRVAMRLTDETRG